MAEKKIGFIGVGSMGLGMVKNMVGKGFPAIIRGHRNRQAMKSQAKLNAVDFPPKGQVST